MTMEDIELMKDEAGGLLYESGVATVSFYRGGDFTSASRAMRAQFERVVASNPWLAGRLVKDASSGGKLVLRHPTHPSSEEVDLIFTASGGGDGDADVPCVPSTSTPYVAMCRELFKKKMIVSTGTSLVNQPAKPVTRLYLAHKSQASASSAEFSLTFSLSHSVGDGRTYYEVLKMLSPGAAVRSLKVARMMHFGEAMRDVCGRRELEWIDSTDAGCMMGCSMIPMLCGMGKKVKCTAFNIDAARLAEAKAASLAENRNQKNPANPSSTTACSYVSTNDVVTSGFFTECGTRIGIMGMDCRERIEGVESDFAGNYVTGLVVDSAVFGRNGQRVYYSAMHTPYYYVYSYIVALKKRPS